MNKTRGDMLAAGLVAHEVVKGSEARPASNIRPDHPALRNPPPVPPHTATPRHNNRPHMLLRPGAERNPDYVRAREAAKSQTVGFTCPQCSQVVYRCTLHQARNTPSTTMTLQKQALVAHMALTGCQEIQAPQPNPEPQAPAEAPQAAPQGVFTELP